MRVDGRRYWKCLKVGLEYGCIKALPKFLTVPDIVIDPKQILLYIVGKAVKLVLDLYNFSNAFRWLRMD